jgi:hypothetical protein
MMVFPFGTLVDMYRNICNCVYVARARRGDDGLFGWNQCSLMGNVLVVGIVNGGGRGAALMMMVALVVLLKIYSAARAGAWRAYQAGRRAARTAEPELAHIFDPFFSTKAVGKATALGLPMAYGIVRAHRARFEVITALGAGSTFRVLLPAQVLLSRLDITFPKEGSSMAPLNATSAVHSGVTDNAAAALLGQLQRLQQQLSECINCASGKTPEGKASADAIRASIGQLEQRIAHSDQVSERRQALLQAGKTEPVLSVAAESGTVAQPRKTSGAGQIIDVFA